MVNNKKPGTQLTHVDKLIISSVQIDMSGLVDLCDTYVMVMPSVLEHYKPESILQYEEKLTQILKAGVGIDRLFMQDRYNSINVIGLIYPMSVVYPIGQKQKDFLKQEYEPRVHPIIYDKNGR